MATVIDALVVSLGLDAKNFVSGSKQVSGSLKTTSDEATRTAKEMEARGAQAAQFFSKIRNEALALLAVFTAGVGIKNFVENTVVGAASLGRLSQNLGMSTERLSAWQRVAEDAGGTAEGMTAQLKESQKAIAAFRMGQSSESLQWFFRMGGKVSDLKDGNTYLLARSKIISDIFKTDPGRAQLVAQQMGISEDQFNLLKQGPDVVLKQVAAMEKLSAISAEDARQADELRKKFLNLERTFALVGIKVVEALMPAFDQLIGYVQKLADWIASHQNDITNWINDAIKSAKEFAQTADKAAQSVGGWKNVLIALAGIKILSMVSPLLGLASALGSVGSALGVIGGVGAAALTVLGGVGAAALYSKGLNKGEDEYLKNHRASVGQKWPGDPIGDKRRAGAGKDATAISAVKSLMDMGWSREQASGLVANLWQESMLNPTAVGDNGHAYGIAQWHEDRQAEFKKLFGIDIRKSSLEQQLQFANYELTQGKEQSAGNRLKSATNALDAGAIVSRYYERPADKEGEATRRAKGAADLYASLGRANAAAVASLTVSNPSNPSQTSSTTNTSSSEVNINGPINIQTQATDAAGVARGLGSAISKYHFVSQANTGLT